MGKLIELCGVKKKKKILYSSCSIVIKSSILQSRRGEQLEYVYVDETRVMMKYRMPLAEVVTDFYDELKSRSSGYASFDYEEGGYEESDLVKVISIILMHKTDTDRCSLDECSFKLEACRCIICYSSS
jgi:translation elongation factor EF-4